MSNRTSVSQGHHHVVPMPKPEWDNSRTAMRRGLTPGKLTAVVEALEAAIEEGS